LALGRQGEYGNVSELARRYGISRPTVYAQAKQAEAALLGVFAPRNDENKPLAVIAVDKARLTRVIIFAYVGGANSLRQVQAFVKDFYGLHVAYGTIHAIIVEAERRAAAFNRGVELSKITTAALDEMFSQGKPVLAGIDLDSGYLFLLEHSKGRSGGDWATRLDLCKKQGLALKTVVKDAGTGLAAGVTKAFPEAEQRDDAFHAIYNMGKVFFRLEKSAWAAMERLCEAERELERVRRQRLHTASASQTLYHARKHFYEAAERHARFEALMKQAREAMMFIGWNSLTPRCGDEQASKLKEIATQMAEIGGKKVRASARYLKNRAPGLALYMDELGGKLSVLAKLYGAELVGLCCQFWRAAKDHERAKNYEKQPLLDATRVIVERIIRLAGDNANEVTAAVIAVIATRHRASSAIEGFNAVLRPYLHVHKRVSQGFLELFMAWRNLRTRPMGKHRGTSAYELVTGDKVNDWLSLLGYPLPNAA